MRFLHVSDTHIGFAAYHRLTPDGLNQREVDFFDAFARAIDVALEERVDFVLHSGDLFDSVRPTNRAITHALAQIQRLGDIPFVVISGNHEAPRLRETGAVLRLLDFLPNAHAIYKGKYEKVVIGDCAIHGVPHCASSDDLVQQLRLVREHESARYNVATLHAGVVGVGDFRTGEFNEQVVPQNEIPAGMDYVALGHYHRATAIAERVWYAGSTERCTFKECGEDKIVNVVDLAKDTVRSVTLPSRRMVTLKPVHLEGMVDTAMGPTIYERLAEAGDLSGAIARLKVTGLPPPVYSGLDHPRIKQMTSAALHFDFQTELARDEAVGAASGALGALADEFEAYLEKRPVESDDRDELLDHARRLLLAAESGEEEAA